MRARSVSGSTIWTRLIGFVGDIVVGVEPPEERLEIVGGQAIMGGSSAILVESDSFRSEDMNGFAIVVRVGPTEPLSHPAIGGKDSVGLE